MDLPTSQCWLEAPIEPPTSTHQANLRVLKTKTGRLFVGKMKKNKVTKWVDQMRPYLVRGKPLQPMEGAVRVCIRLYYTSPKYLLPKINKCKELVKTTKPDVDNVVKVILDEMTKCGYWLDDSQIWCITIEKYWSATPKVCIYYDQKTQNQ
jgi:Holliday junction resolvase RusA-like endonuclease